ncbi:MAG TPA: hypothetical protein DDY43_02610, partial [Synechococcales bacterium UBA10510]|nr:hypothetical protein [Synechococcales bacterium UBA10510]
MFFIISYLSLGPIFSICWAAGFVGGLIFWPLVGLVCGGVGGGMGDKLVLEPRDFWRNWLAGGSAKLNLAFPVSTSTVPASAALLDPRRQQGEGAALAAAWLAEQQNAQAQQAAGSNRGHRQTFLLDLPRSARSHPAIAGRFAGRSGGYSFSAP